MKQTPWLAILAVLFPLSAALAAYCGVFAPAPPPTLCNFFVSSSGSDSNNGLTESTPVQTLPHVQTLARAASSKVICIESGSSYTLSSQLALTSADNGETWQYDPAGAVDAATISGGGSVTDLVSISGASNITLNGIQLSSCVVSCIHAQFSARNNAILIENMKVSSVTDPNVVTSAGILIENCTSCTVMHNAVVNTAAQGISMFAYQAGTSLNGSVMSSNVVLQCDQTLGDSGAYYTDMDGTGTSGGSVSIINNYSRDCGVTGVYSTGVIGVYLDDNSSNVTVEGNVVGAPANGGVNSGNSNFTAAFQIHNGCCNTIKNNLVDLGNSSYVAAAQYAQDSTGQGNMSSNVYTNNIVISSYTGSNQAQESGICCHGFFASNNFTNPTSNPSWFDVTDNAYNNYSTGTVDTSGYGISGDSSPHLYTAAQLALTCTNAIYSIGSTSVVLSAPVSFQQLVTGWGPAGYTIPSSTNHSC